MKNDILITDVVRALERDDLLPAIVFRTARAQCDMDAERAVQAKSMLLPPERQREIRKRIDEICAAYDMDRDLLITHQHFKSLVWTGIGAHHAGQLLIWRLLLEELMASGMLRVLVATGTVAAGVDFPARTVVITAHSRRGATGFESLTASEFQQMSGRAGRRGRDAIGFCIAAPAPFCDARVLLKIAHQQPEPLVSSYFPGPSTVLNLLRYRNVDDLRYTVERSLASFIDRKHARQMEHAASEVVDELSRDAQAMLIEEMKLEATGEDPTGKISPGPGVTLSRDEKKQMKKVRRLRREAAGLVTRQSHLLDSALNGLEKLGYLKGTSLSDKGYWAAYLCTNLVIELGELIESDLLKDVSAERLAALIASLSGDPHRQYLRTKTPPISKEDVTALGDILNRVRSANMPGASDDRSVLPDAAHTVITWLQAESWQQFRAVLMLSGVAEGDAARLITQTAEQLNQIARLSESHQQLAFRAEEARRRILRPPLTEVLNLEGL